MPHSRSLPFNTLLSTNTTTSSATYTTLLPKESLQKVVENALGPQYVQDALKTRTRGIVNSCGSGMTAAVIWLALQELGIDSALYDEVRNPSSISVDRLSSRLTL
jgi:thiosulfate/3-mercaptopyruvate sulfurtransferase